MRLVLASNSPRRRELLSKLNYDFQIIPAACEEKTTAANPRDMSKEIACRKALDVYRSNRDAVVIGCDTVVDLDGRALGKPKSFDEATDILTRLSGRSHTVHTGVCVVSQGAVYLFAETSQVSFRHLEQKEIIGYVNSGSPMDKAGAYGVQDSGFVDNIIGSYYNVMGFPSEKIEAILKKI